MNVRACAEAGIRVVDQVLPSRFLYLMDVLGSLSGVMTSLAAVCGLAQQFVELRQSVTNLLDGGACRDQS